MTIIVNYSLTTLSFCFSRKREVERRREAKQQLSLTGAKQKQQISLAAARVEKLSLDVAEQNVEMKDPITVKGHKHRKSSAAHNSQSQSRREKQQRTGGWMR